jgi:Rrf2 family protein
MISQKTKYAIKALMALADEVAAGGNALTIEEIATRSGAPKRFLEHIMLELRNAGYVGSRRGRAGGYVLIKQPKEISIGELLRQVDGPIAPLPCLSDSSPQPCLGIALDATPPDGGGDATPQPCLAPLPPDAGDASDQ